MSVSRKVLRRMKKVMGVVGAIPVLAACSSQVSCAETIWFDKQQNGNYVHYEYDWTNKTLTISGNGVVTSSWLEHDKPGAWLSKPKVVIKEGITEIGAGAFRGKHISDVDFPNSVTTIGEYAFYAASLESLRLPDSVIRIGSYAFAHSDVENVFISNKVKEVGDFAFANCKQLKKVIFNNVDNPGTKFSTGDNVFCDCMRLQLFSTGDFDCDKNINNYRIAQLGSNVFFGCDELLHHVNNKRIQGFIDCKNKNYEYRLVLKK